MELNNHSNLNLIVRQHFSFSIVSAAFMLLNTPYNAVSSLALINAIGELGVSVIKYITQTAGAGQLWQVYLEKEKKKPNGKGKIDLH